MSLCSVLRGGCESAADHQWRNVRLLAWIWSEESFRPDPDRHEHQEVSLYDVSVERRIARP